MEEIENCIWGLGVSATVQMSHLMQIFNFSLRDCVFTIHYGFDVEKNGVGCCKCTKFGPGATFLIFLLHFHDLEINEEWQRRWWVCGCGVWENSMQARMHPPTAPPTYQSDRLLGHWLPCVCVWGVMLANQETHTLRTVHSANALSDGQVECSWGMVSNDQCS